MSSNQSCMPLSRWHKYLRTCMFMMNVLCVCTLSPTSSFHFPNRPTTQTHVTVVQRNRLPGRHCFLRLQKFHMHTTTATLSHHAIDQLRAVPYAALAPHTVPLTFQHSHRTFRRLFFPLSFSLFFSLFHPLSPPPHRSRPRHPRKRRAHRPFLVQRRVLRTSAHDHLMPLHDFVHHKPFF